MSQPDTDTTVAALFGAATLAAAVRNLPDDATASHRRSLKAKAARALAAWRESNGPDHLDEAEERADFFSEVRVAMALRSTLSALRTGTPLVARAHAYDLADEVRAYADGVTYGIDPFPRDIAKVVRFITR